MKTAIYNKIKRVAMLVLLSAMFVPAIQAQEILHLFYKGGGKEKIEITSDTKVEFVKQPYLEEIYYTNTSDTVYMSATSGRTNAIGGVKANVPWTLSTDADWLFARRNVQSQFHYPMGDGMVEKPFLIFAEANKTDQMRTAKVIINTEHGISKEIVVAQYPFVLSLTPMDDVYGFEPTTTSTEVLPWECTQYNFYAYPGFDVKVASYPQWMKLETCKNTSDYFSLDEIKQLPDSITVSHEQNWGYGKGYTYAYFTCEQNQTPENRTGEIVFEGRGQRAVITIIQEGLNESTMIRATKDLQQMLYTNGGAIGQGHPNDFGVPSMMLFTESRGMDLVNHNTGYNWFKSPLRYTDIDSGEVPTYVYWRTLYYNIAAINRNVNQLKGMEDNQYARSYLAQAYALRAFDYFYLAQMYEHTYVGNEDALCVPIITEDNMSQQYTIGIPRATVREVYDYILTNLDKAIALLQGNTIAYPGKEFISTEAAYGLRARINLVMNRWEAAAADAQRVIDSGVAQPYTRDEVSRPSFADINDHAWLWGIDAEETDPTVISGTINWPSHMGTFSYGYAQVGAWRMVSQSLFQAIPSTDVRKGWFLNDKRVSPNLNEEQKAYIQYYSAPAYTQVKFAPYNDVLGNSYTDLNASDIPLMRIEEMYLILAEAKAMLGDVAKGAEVLNSFVVNYRDPAYNCTASTAEELVEEVWMQRRIELWGEGHAYYDLMRLKKPIDRRGAGFEAPYVFYVPDGDAARIYPIPAAEMGYSNPALVQNPEATLPQPVQ